MVSMDDIQAIGQHGSFLWCMVSPMDDIWVIGQHGSCLCCPWMTYGSLVNMDYCYRSQYFFEDAVKKSKEIANRYAIGSDGENNSRFGKNFSSRGFQDEECDECFYYDNFDLGLTLLRQAVDEDHLEEIYLLGMIYISRGPHQCDEGLQLLDAYFGWAVPDDGEYTDAVDSAKVFLWVVDVVHRLTTNNITFQYENPRYSTKGAFAIGHEQDEDLQRYCMVCRWMKYM
ncbi:unnamed protein product [Lactuca saligna]|uniref:Uncharacterized protein n=1 Tax=Lactuca saligna TaxID=75948 RepID=A0AA35VHP2_LACSI|nr:unnamed protein product [Lactuca saligna]